MCASTTNDPRIKCSNATLLSEKRGPFFSRSEIGDEGGRVVGAALQVRHDVAPHAVDYPPIKLSDAQYPDKTIRRPLDQERETTR